MTEYDKIITDNHIQNHLLEILKWYCYEDNREYLEQRIPEMYNQLLNAFKAYKKPLKGNC